MSDEKIEVEWIATANKMVQVLDRLEQKFDKQEKQLQKLGDTSKKSADGAANSFNKLEQELKENEAALKRLERGTIAFDEQKKKVDALRGAVDKAKKAIQTVPEHAASWGAVGSSMLKATATAGVLYAALMKLAQAQRQIVEGAADEVVQMDVLARRMQIQAGLTDPQREQQSRQIIEQSSAAGVTAEVGFQAATQLAGSGFQGSVESGTLKTILDTIQATSFQGSPEQLVSSFTEALNAYGLEKTNDNLKAIAVAAQGVFKQTDFQIVELQDFAKNASVFQSAGLSLQQALAGFTTLREVLPAEQSGTGMRNFVSILKTAGGDKSNTAALGKMGLTPQQVDFVGENLQQVLATLKTATEGMDKASRQITLGNLFGRENIASAELLIARQSRIEELEQLQGDGKQFEKDRATAAGGMQAERNRIANEEILERTDRATELNRLDVEQRRRDNEMQSVRERAAVSGIPGAGAAAVVATGVESTVDTVIGKPVMQDTSTRLAFVFSSLFGSQERTNKLIDKMVANQEQTNKLLEKKEPAKPVAPAVRPKEAQLPAVTSP